ncbi:unnamed protein product [Miscanthus lutarioriparius]|uniref:Uncharacterized protein n=1 Tax=Miscanthus lutarioriparius TaxID=422564 RepID=A0A811RQC6_9POAL|nr:unnamed protein product [Miscanthus lutarioriparius]
MHEIARGFPSSLRGGGYKTQKNPKSKPKLPRFDPDPKISESGYPISISDSEFKNPISVQIIQLFEGIGLGGCIVQAKFRLRSMVAMALFFSLTTPIGVAMGIAISSAYDETSPTALVVQGFLEAAAAGILVYMALVDILAEDFLSARVQSRARLQVALNTSLLLGAGLMSMLAIWA